MNLKDYDRKNIVLTNGAGDKFKGICYYCDKEDYEAAEDGLELKVGNDICIFYESDINSIEIMK